MYCDRVKNKRCAKRDLRRSCPKKAFIECGVPSGAINFLNTGQTINTSLVTVDISSFIKPAVDIHFSNEIEVILQPDDSVTPPETAEVELQYDLVCRPDDGINTIVGSWTYKRLLTVNDLTPTDAQRLKTSDTFSFNKCLFPEPSKGCIEYFVTITAVTISVNNEIV